MPRSVDARILKQWLREPAELALLDVREPGEFGESHLFHAIPLPYSRLEIDAPRLVPRRATRLVLCDDGHSGVAQRAALRLEAAGYGDVHVLAGGTQGWRAAGFGLFAGVNVPSKVFGELVEHGHDTPRIKPAELKAMADRGDNFVIVDGRPFSEYGKMNIPGGICCPNGELALRAQRIAPDPNTTIVVNCAGRTRSIIGAQSLLSFGIANRVVALENGTQGWFLAGLKLENGAARRYPEAPTGAELDALRQRSQALIQRFNIPHVDAAQAGRWFADQSRTTYLFDVRTAEEFAAGSLPGAVHAPGGQLVQATDQWVGVRGARMVLADAEGVRAPVVAMWLRQMGHDAYVLSDGVNAPLRNGPVANAIALPALEQVGAGALGDARLIDLRASAVHRAGHPRGAVWGVRPRIVAAAAGAQRVALIATEPAVARMACVDLREAGVREIVLLDNVSASQLGQETTPDVPPDAERIDFLFFTHDRHEGNRDAALRYLEWETQLLGQLDADERAVFRLPG